MNATGEPDSGVRARILRHTHTANQVSRCAHLAGVRVKLTAIHVKRVTKDEHEGFRGRTNKTRWMTREKVDRNILKTKITFAFAFVFGAENVVGRERQLVSFKKTTDPKRKRLSTNTKATKR